MSSGIASINKKIETITESAGGGMEMFITKSGDSLFFAVPSELDDSSVADYYRHQVRLDVGGQMKHRYLYCKNHRFDMPCKFCDILDKDPQDHKRQWCFAFWAYIFSQTTNIQPKSMDGWKEETTRSGRKYYERDVQEWKLITLPFGRSRSNWNNFNELYENDNFSKVIKLVRNGEMLDTNYSFSAVNSKEVKFDELVGFSELPAVHDYFLEKALREENIIAANNDNDGEVSKPMSLSDDGDDSPPWNTDTDDEDNNDQSNSSIVDGLF